jgi:glutamate racemase
MHDSRPIGVFDSGIGGLTIAHGMVEQMPHESIIYFGDTQHLPYGDKSAGTVKRYSLEISRFLIRHNCKAIVIACNTASALAFDAVKNQFPDVKVYNVIDPVVEVVASLGLSNVGVIGTRSTIGSGIYSKKIKKATKNVNVHALATPLLVPMVEEGYHNQNISKEIIASYLSLPELESIDELILGCTHFPLIKNEINEYYGGRVVLIDSPTIVAKKIFAELEANKMLSNNKNPHHSFFVSDLTDSFAKSASRFFSDNVNLKECRLWEGGENACL